MKHLLFAMAITSILLLGCAKSKNIDYDKTVNFSDINSFSVKPPSNNQDEFGNALVVKSIESNLSTKGLENVDVTLSDISVVFLQKRLVSQVKKVSP